MAKFHVKAITLYGVKQLAETISVILSEAESTGSVSVTSGDTAVTGVGTSFLLTVTPGAYLYSGGVLSAQILSVESDTALTLVSGAAATLAAVAFSVGMGPKNALAALNLNYSTELTTEQFEFLGDELSRDEITVITDKYAKFDFETFQPKLGDIAGATPTVDEIPMAEWFEASGMGAVLETGAVTYTNSVVSNEFLSIEVRRSSPDVATDKTYTMTDCRGTLDPSIQIGSKMKLKFDFMGNLTNVVQKAKLVADYGTQKASLAVNANSQTVQLSRLLLWAGGVEPADTGNTNFCFSKLEATNGAGFEYGRYQTSCEDGWSKGAVPSDVTVTIIEDEAGAVYNPDNQLAENHTLVVRYGVAAGEKVELYYHKLTLNNVGSSEVAKYSGQDLTFRNVATLDLKLS